MRIGELTQGSDIRVKLRSNMPAVPRRVGDQVVYSTELHMKKLLPRKPGDLPFVEGHGTVISNTGNKIKMSFVGLINLNFTGVAEVDYLAFDSVHLWEGETNESTLKRAHKLDFNLEEEVEFKGAVPPMKIYRKKIQLIWTDTL